MTYKYTMCMKLRKIENVVLDWKPCLDGFLLDNIKGNENVFTILQPKDIFPTLFVEETNQCCDGECLA